MDLKIFYLLAILMLVSGNYPWPSYGDENVNDNESPKKPSDPYGQEYVDENGSITIESKGSPSDIRFFLYTTKNPQMLNELFVNDTESLTSSNFIKDAPVKFITHGWRGSVNSSFPQDMKDAYLNVSKGKRDLNVICTDWSILSSNPFYPQPVGEVPLVGSTAADLILNIISADLSTIEKFHLIGHSLGAHVSGAIGMNLKKIQKNVTRISGLDPAKPLFELASKDYRIDKTDGDNVDIIHSTGLTVGLFRTLGSADFYPNDGIIQAGCGIDFSCDHSRAHQYFTESIFEPLGFKSCKCPDTGLPTGPTEFLPLILLCKCTNANSTAYMGEYLSNSTQGIYYLQTNSQPPYAKY